ncbi:MAG: flavodoxin domain-containing protein [Hyphomicrobiales bacterium]
MKNIIVLYWNKGGNVESAAREIQQAIGTNKVDISDIDSFDIITIQQYDLIIAGSATVGAERWEDARNDNKWNPFFVKLSEQGIEGKNVAIFGLGDQLLYPNHFVNDMVLLKERFVELKVNVVGNWSTDGYEFNESESVIDNMFCGLALDIDRQAYLNQERIFKWTQKILEETKL